jgi:hypothetical protein
MPVEDVLLRVCEADVDLLERYIRTWPLSDYTTLLAHEIFNTVSTLVTLLDEPRSHDLFTRACALMRFTSHDFPLTRFVMSGLEATAWSLNQPIPSEAREYIDYPSLMQEENWDNLPISIVLPRGVEIEEALGSEGQDWGATPGELGRVVSRWRVRSTGKRRQ